MWRLSCGGSETRSGGSRSNCVPAEDLLLVGGWQSAVLEQRQTMKISDFKKGANEKRRRLVSRWSVIFYQGKCSATHRLPRHDRFTRRRGGLHAGYVITSRLRRLNCPKHLPHVRDVVGWVTREANLPQRVLFHSAPIHWVRGEDPTARALANARTLGDHSWRVGGTGGQ